VNREVQMLSNLLKEARLWGHIQSDYRPLRMKRSTIGQRLTDAQEKLLLERASSGDYPDYLRDVILLAINTGLRSGEIKRLRIGEVSICNETIFVNAEGTKNVSGVRPVPLNRIALVSSQRLLERAASVGATAPDHFLLPADRVKHTREPDAPPLSSRFDPSRNQKSWRTAWRNLTKECGLAGLRFHDLRHHFISKLGETETPIQVTMALVGHMSPEMTRYYTHISDGSTREAVSRIICS